MHAGVCEEEGWLFVCLCVVLCRAARACVSACARAGACRGLTAEEWSGLHDAATGQHAVGPDQGRAGRLCPPVFALYLPDGGVREVRVWLKRIVLFIVHTGGGGPYEVDHLGGGMRVEGLGRRENHRKAPCG